MVIQLLFVKSLLSCPLLPNPNLILIICGDFKVNFFKYGSQIRSVNLSDRSKKGEELDFIYGGYFQSKFDNLIMIILFRAEAKLLWLAPPAD